MEYIMIFISYALLIAYFYDNKNKKTNTEISDVENSTINISGDANIKISDIKDSKITIK